MAGVFQLGYTQCLGAFMSLAILMVDSAWAGYSAGTLGCFADFESAKEVVCKTQNPDVTSNPPYAYYRLSCVTTSIPYFTVNARMVNTRTGVGSNFSYQAGPLAACDMEPQTIELQKSEKPLAEPQICVKDPKFANPIHPLSGRKKEVIQTGLTLGNLELKFAYDSGRKLLADSIGVVPSSLGDLPSAGGIWRSNFHRRLLISEQGLGVKLFRGDGAVASFRYQNGVYSSDPDQINRLESTTLEYRYIDFDKKAVEIYNLQGQLVKLADASGNVLNFSYSTNASSVAPSDGYLIHVADQNGRRVDFHYELVSGGNPAKDGRISRVSTSAGQDLLLAYDSTGNLSALTWEDGAVRQFLYENSALPWALTGVVDENTNRYSSFGYNSKGLATSSQLAGGVNRYLVEYKAEPEFYVLQTYEPSSNATYRSHERIVPQSTTMVLPNGQSLEINADNVLGVPSVTSMSQPAGSGCLTATSASTYDVNGNIASRDNFSGQRSCYVYDARNRETVRVEGLATNVACSSVTPAGSVLPIGARKIATIWHADWNLAKQVDGPNRRTTTVYHGQPDPFNGNAIAGCTSAVPMPNGKPMPLVCKTVEQVLMANGTVDSSVPSVTASYSYDSAGRLLTATDSKGQTTTRSHYSDIIFASDGPVESYDSYFSNVSLLLRGNGSNGSTAFTNESSTQTSQTAFGNAQVSSGASKFGGASMYLDGAGDYISVSSSPALHFDAGDFTIEAWINPIAALNANTVQKAIVSKWNGASNLSWLVDYAGGNIRGVFRSGTTSLITQGAVSIPANSWTHIAYSRSGNNLYIFVNGVLVGSTATTLAMSSSTAPVLIGYKGDGSGTEYFGGYIDDLRITKGVARYTANFTPSTTEFASNGPIISPNDIGHTVGDLQSITNPAGHVTQFTQYDRAGRVRQMIDPKGVVTDITYTPRGWVSTVAITAPGASARTTTYTYDNVGQLTGVAHPDGSTLSYSYDAAHRLVGVTDAKGNSVTYTLDNSGNRIAEEIKDPTGVLQRSIGRSFDALNRVQQVTGAAQ